MDASVNPVIDQLIPYYQTSEFETLFQKITANDTTNAKFLLKMELARRAAPCVRVIDFRNTAGTAAKPVEVNGIKLYITDEDAEVLNAELKLYRGKYTMGVYEKVMDAHKNRSSEAKFKEDNDIVPVADMIEKLDVDEVRFASYFYRSEERMLYSSPAVLNIPGLDPIDCKTSDLSCGGIKLSVEKIPPFQRNQQCTITFTGLKQVVADPKDVLTDAPYNLLASETKNGKNWVIAVKKIKSPAFESVIDDFIQSNKLKYSVSVDNLLTAVETKGYEQSYMPRTVALPLFFSNEEIPNLIYCLKSENNQKSIEYWRDESNKDRLPTLFPPKRIMRYLPKDKECIETFIYSFRFEAQNKTHFFSATIEELEESNLKRLFFTFGSARPSWRVFKFSIEKCDLSENNVERYIEDGLPEAIHDRTRKDLLSIGYLGQLIEIKDSEHSISDYKENPVTDQDANDLQIFAHGQTTVPCKIELLHYIKMRKEPRYAHSTPVTLLLANGKTVSGQTNDISTMGLQLVFTEAQQVNRRDVVFVSFPKLQTLTDDMKLKILPYKIVHFNQQKTILHLEIEGSAQEHVGRIFFQKLIESNRDTLVAMKELQKLSCMSISLRLVFTKAIFNTPLYLNRSKINRMGAVGTVERPRRIYNLLKATSGDRKGKLNLFPLFSDKQHRRLIVDTIQHMSRQTIPEEIVLFIGRNFDKDGNLFYETKLDSEFKTFKDKRLFMAQCVKRRDFWALKLYLTRAGRPDMEHVQKELDYISKYALHKAKRLEESIWSIIGVCDLVDITKEALFAADIPYASITEEE